MRKFRKKCENLAKKWKSWQKKTKCKILAKKLRKFIKKDFILRIQDSFLKRDLFTSPMNGLSQNINIDLRTTRRHQIFREIFALFIFAKNLRNATKFFFRETFRSLETLIYFFVLPKSCLKKDIIRSETDSASLFLTISANLLSFLHILLCPS